MSQLREPGLGPIVGHTTETSCRLWIRAGDPGDEGSRLASDRRTLGVLGIWQIDGKKVPNPKLYYFRMHRKYDRTGTFNLGEEVGIKDKNPSPKLKPGTEYQVKLGTLTLDDPFDDDHNIEDDNIGDILPPPNVWEKGLSELPDKTSLATFRTFGPGDKLSFIVGSCRYPGLFWKTKSADKIFGPLLQETRNKINGVQPSFVLMVGDQIYADKFNRIIPISLADTFEEFQDRYLKAFGSRNMRKLLRTVPHYMILDDHEIEDNWSQDRLRKSAEARKVFNLAIGSYMSYQWSHSPRNQDNRLFYNFDCSGFPFFVLDTRTQRYMDNIEEDLSDNHLLGRPSLDPSEPSQLEILLNWLKGQPKNIPKFIISSSVFVPNPMSAREERVEKMSTAKRKAELRQNTDSWPAFPNTRRALLKCITENKIQNVIFVSGDIHCSNVAQMFFSGIKGVGELKAFSITSSAFYWPFWFADGDPSDYVHDSKLKGQGDTFDIEKGLVMDYKAWNFTQQDNYCRIDVDRKKHELKVYCYGSDGNIVQKKNKKKLITTFRLAKW